MKKTEVIEILDYMFEFLFLSSEEGSTTEIDDKTIKQHLSDAGFDDSNIENALDYLKNMATEVEVEVFNKSNSGLRIYNNAEKQKLGTAGVGLLTYLDNNKSITPQVREMIVEQVVELPYECSTEELLWIAESAAMNMDNPGLPDLLNSIDYSIDKVSTRH